MKLNLELIADLLKCRRSRAAGQGSLFVQSSRLKNRVSDTDNCLHFTLTF